MLINVNVRRHVQVYVCLSLLRFMCECALRLTCARVIRCVRVEVNVHVRDFVCMSWKVYVAILVKEGVRMRVKVVVCGVLILPNST